MATTAPIKLLKYKTSLELSLDGGPLPRAVEDRLVEQLTYTHVRFLHGHEAFDQDTGERIPVSAEDRRLYRISDRGRLCCTSGFVPRVQKFCKKLGYETEFVDKTPHLRPQAYEEDWDNVAQNYEFKDRQDEMLCTLADHPEGGIFKAPPGFGKSYFFAAIALLYPKARIAIVIPGLSNVTKSVRHLQSVLPSVGQVGGGERDTSCRITVCSANSMHYLNEEDIDILIVDEAHKLIAEEHSLSLIQICGMARCYAFTATPEGRKDGTDIRLEAIFGERLFDMTNQQGVEAGLILPVEVHWHNVFMRNNPCFNADGTKMYDVERKRWGIWRNRDRNFIISNICRQIESEGGQVLVLLDVVEHALYLQEFLPDYPIVYSSMDKKKFSKFVRQGVLDEDHQILNNTDRDRMYEDFRNRRLMKCIATSVWSTGVSFESLEDVVRGDARNGSQIYDEQLAGRTQRLNAESSKTVGRVHDLLDQFDEGFHRAAQTRKRNYKRVGYKQIEPTASPRQLRLRIG